MKNLFGAIQDTASDDAFIHSVQDDPEAYALSNKSVLRPESAEASADWKLYLTEKCLLGVIISIIAPPPGDHQETTTPKPTPVPIAIISLSGRAAGARAPPQQLHQHRPSERVTAARPWTGVVDWGFRTAGLHRIGIECFSCMSGEAS